MLDFNIVYIHIHVILLQVILYMPSQGLPVPQLQHESRMQTQERSFDFPCRSHLWSTELTGFLV